MTQHGKRVDYEYERNGTASIFMFAEPLSGFRQATARARRTKGDWALEVAQLLDRRYVACAKVTLVCDNLNTHTKGAFYEAFPPECVFHGFLPPSPSEGCHAVHVNAATQSTGCLPPSPRERCHVDHGKVATHARRSLPPSEQRDAGSLWFV
jgi:hypothetical protein